MVEHAFNSNTAGPRQAVFSELDGGYPGLHRHSRPSKTTQLDPIKGRKKKEEKKEGAREEERKEEKKGEKKKNQLFFNISLIAQ